MYFAWDDTKSKFNKQKHGISFELAKHIFEDPHLLSWLDKRSLVLGDNSHCRWATIQIAG